MGKLHKIRRAIKRDPSEWMYDNGTGNIARGAHLTWEGKWEPMWYWDDKPYRTFVRSVLKEMGYNVE